MFYCGMYGRVGKKDKLENSEGEKVMLILTMNFNIEKLQKCDLL